MYVMCTIHLPYLTQLTLVRHHLRATRLQCLKAVMTNPNI